MNSPMNTNVIKGFEKLTPQQVFDISLKHVRTTRKQCVVDKACSYKGIGCAAAPFLSEVGKKTLMGGWHLLAHIGDVPKNNASLIDAIQNCHDGWMPSYDLIFMDHFNSNMEHVARRYSLVYTPENV